MVHGGPCGHSLFRCLTRYTQGENQVLGLERITPNNSTVACNSDNATGSTSSAPPFLSSLSGVCEAKDLRKAISFSGHTGKSLRVDPSAVRQKWRSGGDDKIQTSRDKSFRITFTVTGEWNGIHKKSSLKLLKVRSKPREVKHGRNAGSRCDDRRGHHLTT
jgi:hypothetical protein